MPRILYETKKMRPERLELVDQANRILQEYAAQGYDLTLRQLYYQHVARGLIPAGEARARGHRTSGRPSSTH